MNTDTLEGRWTQLKGKAREKWGRLTNDDIDVIGGKRDQLVGILQRRYGQARDEIERQVDEFEHENKQREKAPGDRPGADHSPR
jgi:uncharacterized protein YjbJ (UPF0337 family)